MNRLGFVICGLGLMAAPAFAVDSCASFAGAWEGLCPGETTGHAFTIQQDGCQSLRHSQPNGADFSLELSGNHPLYDGAYTAQWEPNEKALHIVMVSSIEGHYLTSLKYDLIEGADKTQTITFTTLVKDPGQSTAKEIGTCTAKRTH